MILNDLPGFWPLRSPSPSLLARPTRSRARRWLSGTRASQPRNHLTSEAIDAKNGWTPIANGETKHVFQGDAVIANGRVLAVARKHAASVELYSLGSGKPVFRARLLQTADAASSARCAATDNSATTLGFERSSKSGATRFRLKKGEPFVEVQALADAKTLRIECPSRFAALPDFFADDLVFDALLKDSGR